VATRGARGAAWAAVWTITLAAAGCGGSGGGESSSLGDPGAFATCATLPPDAGTATAPAPVACVNRAGPTVTLSWDPNREAAVNAPGGGYRVSRGPTAGFDVAAGTPVYDAAYTTGPTAPTTAVISGLGPGVHYLKVVGYSSLGGGSESAPSAEVCVRLP
jgi:hypothetical protein